MAGLTETGWLDVCLGLKSESLSVFGGRCDRSVSSYLFYQWRVSLCERIEKTHNGNSTVTIDWCSWTEPINESYPVYSQGRYSVLLHYRLINGTHISCLCVQIFLGHSRVWLVNRRKSDKIFLSLSLRHTSRQKKPRVHMQTNQPWHLPACLCERIDVFISS